MEQLQTSCDRYCWVDIVNSRSAVVSASLADLMSTRGQKNNDGLTKRSYGGCRWTGTATLVMVAYVVIYSILAVGLSG